MSPSGQFIVLAHKTKQNGGRLLYILTRTRYTEYCPSDN